MRGGNQTLANGFAYTAAELPRETVETGYVLPTGTVHRVNGGGDLQAALNAASRGDIVVLEAGATFTGNFTLPQKAGTDWIYVVSSTVLDGVFPKAPGERVSPADAGSMAKIHTPNGTAAITALGGDVSYYRFVGIEIAPSPANTLVYSLISWGTASTASDQTPTHLILDRCYVHGHTGGTFYRGLALNSAHSAVIDSYFTEFHAPGNDTQAIMGWNGPGPYKIENNYLAGAGENVMFGGGDPRLTGVLPSDIEIRRNHFYKPLSWQGVWNMKNHFEVKSGQRILVEANVFENSWVGGQAGWSIVLKSVNQDGGHNSAAARDITIRHNIIRNVNGGFDLIGFQALSGGTVAEHLSRVTIVNNVVYELRRGAGGVNGRLFKISTGSPSDIYISHNTAFPAHSLMTLWEGVRVSGLVLSDNIFGHGDYGLFGNGVGEGRAALTAYAPGASVVGNVFIGSNQSNYPAGNFYPSSENEVGFVAFSSGNYRLTAGSPYKGQATDGTDPGANLDVIEAATQGVVNP